MVENILNSYNKASSAQIEEGLNWYRDANQFARTLPVPLTNAAAVISALSPANKWSTNKLEAQAIIHNVPGYRFCTYGQNVEKARIALREPEPERLFSEKTGYKTLSFYHNILNPEDPNWVTIDRHAAAVAEGRENSGSVRLTVKQYRAYAEAYKTAAFILGILPCQLQAICWVQHISKISEDIPF